MVVYKEPSLAIYVGDARQSFIPGVIRQEASYSPSQLTKRAPFDYPSRVLDITHLVFLHQIHSKGGITVTKENYESLPVFGVQGDFLVTSLPQIGLGITSADCLPVILYDAAQQVIAAVHAGWRGSVDHVAVEALHVMKNAYGTDPHHVRVFFGPSANQCCYEVGLEVAELLSPFSYTSEILQQKNNTFILNVPLLNQRQLEHEGVLPTSFNKRYNFCTMCLGSFCSYRRKPASLERQMTIVRVNRCS